MADDWGCFNSNSLIIRGISYPLRTAEMTIKKIDELKTEYNQKGLLFLWSFEDREWGFFPSWDNHHSYCNKTNSDNAGKQQKHRRKTPKPDPTELSEYLQRFGAGLVHLSTSSDKILKNLNPIPIPIPIPNPREPDKRKTAVSPSQFETFLNDIGFLEHQAEKLGKSRGEVLEMIEKIRDHSLSKNEKYYDLPATLRNWFKNNFGNKNKSGSKLTDADIAPGILEESRRMKNAKN